VPAFFDGGFYDCFTAGNKINTEKRTMRIFRLTSITAVLLSDGAFPRAIRGVADAPETDGDVLERRQGKKYESLAGRFVLLFRQSGIALFDQIHYNTNHSHCE
jgi:hypothetical protein